MPNADHSPPSPAEPQAQMRGTDQRSCPFCQIIASLADQGVCIPVTERFVTFPAKHQRPGNRGHMLLVPVGHRTTMQELSPYEELELVNAWNAVGAAVRDATGATGITIRMNLGPPGQDVAHLHLHVIPRHPENAFAHTASRELSLAERLAIADQVRAHLVADVRPQRTITEASPSSTSSPGSDA
ncbi:HIT family protein [Hamadaea sp. NPDC051192]|uniref:HIT family protein n=1 Tax=Hamadaea sp. NPDC051192 TaxID=3154940 RepID=UPI0034468770